MEKVYYTITTQTLQQLVTQNPEEALQAFRNKWQVVKTVTLKTFTRYSAIKTEVTTEVTEESEIL